jgi:hypothetical protein
MQARHDVLTCPASTNVGYVEVGHITQSLIEGAGHEKEYRRNSRSTGGVGVGYCAGLESLWGIQAANVLVVRNDKPKRLSLIVFQA